jgi:prepilin-type N-terminal cleavage/methylation domain-containing protein
MRRSRGADGFTLVEILTVMAIIAVLFVLLFPVFTGVRNKARETQCVSQMRQIVTALNLYRQDFDEKDTGASYVDLSLPKRVSVLVTLGSLKEKSIFLCPDRFVAITADDPRVLSHYIFYDAYNVTYADPANPGHDVYRSTNFAEKYTQDSSFPAICCPYHDAAYYGGNSKGNPGPVLLGVGLNGTLTRRNYVEIFPPKNPGP